MKELILLKCGEIALKGLNRASFEDALIKNIKRRLRGMGEFRIYKAQSTLYVEPTAGCDLDAVVEALGFVFGIAGICRALIVEKDFTDIREKSAPYLRDALMRVKTFKVEAKRSDKSFPMTSPEICAQLGGYLLEQFPHLRVDVQQPDAVVTVEIRDFAAYIHVGQLPGAGGLPTGTSGKAALLLSGGIDSPVAGYMMGKRGLSITAVHFASPPYTSERAKQKVFSLAKIISRYCGNIHTVVVPFTEIQEAIKQNCPEEFFTIIMRRFMMRLAQRIAKDDGCGAIITGESLAQVASQTLLALGCTDAVCDLPVLRPVIGMDKTEIVEIARKIETFDTSILPYEDCCTVFTPRHPKTKPRIGDIERAEENLDIPALIERSLANLEIVEIRA